MAVVLLLMPGSQCDAPTAYDAALIAMVPCWELRMSFRNYNLWRLTHVGHVDTKSQNAQHRFTAPTSQKFRCTPVLHDIKMPLANASAVWQNVGHKLHWQEPVWKVIFHRQSFFRTLFEYPFRIILFARCERAQSFQLQCKRCASPWSHGDVRHDNHQYMIR